MSLRSRVLFLTLLTLVVLCWVACESDSTVTAVQPFYTEKDVIYDPALIGTWLSALESGIWALQVEEAPKPKEGEKPALWYKVTMTSGGSSSDFTAYLFKLGDARFLDVYPLDPRAPFTATHELMFNAVRVHLLFRFKLDNDTLHLATLRDSAFTKKVKDTDWQIGVDSSVFLVPTGELQNLISSAGTFRDVYSDELRLSRAESDSYARDLLVAGSAQLCESRYGKRDAAGALPYCKQVVETAPYLPDGHRAYADVLGLNGDGDQARAEIAASFKLCREMQKTGFWDVYCTTLGGDAKTFDDYVKAIEAEEHRLRAKSFFVDEKWAETAQEFEKSEAASGMPETDPEMAFAWALALRSTGHKQEAVGLLRRNLAENKALEFKNLTNFKAIDILADYFESKLDDKGLLAKSAVVEKEGQPISKIITAEDYYLACMHYANGDLKGAREHFAALQSTANLSGWPDFLATVRLRQITAAEAHKGKAHESKHHK